MKLGDTRLYRHNNKDIFIERIRGGFAFRIQDDCGNLIDKRAMIGFTLKEVVNTAVEIAEQI